MSMATRQRRDAGVEDNFRPAVAVTVRRGVEAMFFPPRLDLRGGAVSTAVCRTNRGGDTLWIATAGTLELRCRIVHSGARCDLEMVLMNRGRRACEVAVRYPALHYRYPDGTYLRRFDPIWGGVLQPTPYAFVRHYPGPASFCLAMVTGGADRALAYGLFNGEQRRCRIVHEYCGHSGQILFELERVAVGPGKAIRLPAGYVAGGAHWGDVLAPYRDWFQSVAHCHQKTPAWYEQEEFLYCRAAGCLAPQALSQGLNGVNMFDAQARRRSFAELKLEVDQAFEQAQTRGLQPLFYQFAWWNNMRTFDGLLLFDAVCGDYEAAHDLTRRVIDYIHRRGGRTYLYTNFIAAGTESAVYRRHPDAFARDAAGFPVRNELLWPLPMMLYCPGAPILRTLWTKTLRFILKDLDADGIFLDQVGGAVPNPFCYDPRHRHAHPDMYGRDLLDLLDFVSRKAREIKADALISQELPGDMRSLWADKIHGQGYTGPAPMQFKDEKAARATPPNEAFVFHAFICPSAKFVPDRPEMVMLGCPGEPDDPVWRRFREVFRTGVRPCRTDAPGAMAYLYGPCGGVAVLAVRAWEELGPVTVDLPALLAPVRGGTDIALPAGGRKVRVAVGRKPRFYAFRSE